MLVKAALFFALLLAVLLAGVVERNSRSYISCPNEQVIPAQTFIKVFPDKRNTDRLRWLILGFTSTASMTLI